MRNSRSCEITQRASRRSWPRRAASTPGRSASRATGRRTRADDWCRAGSFTRSVSAPRSAASSPRPTIASPDAVISYGYWQRRFGGRPDVLGKTFIVRKATLTIVGVAARGFIGETSGQQPDMWIPLRMQPAVLPGRDRLHDTPPAKSMWLNVFGRLKPGVTPAQAEAQAN